MAAEPVKLTPSEDRIFAFFGWIADEGDDHGLLLRMLGISNDEWNAGTTRLLELGFVSAGNVATWQ